MSTTKSTAAFRQLPSDSFIRQSCCVRSLLDKSQDGCHRGDRFVSDLVERWSWPCIFCRYYRARLAPDRPPGARPVSTLDPRLMPWATLFRRFAAERADSTSKNGGGGLSRSSVDLLIVQFWSLAS